MAFFLGLKAVIRKPFLKMAGLMRANEDLGWLPDAGVNVPMYEPSETPDGSETTFTFEVLPAFVYYNGAWLIEGVGYTRSGNSVQLTDNDGNVFAPESGAVIRAIS